MHNNLKGCDGRAAVNKWGRESVEMRNVSFLRHSVESGGQKLVTSRIILFEWRQSVDGNQNVVGFFLGFRFDVGFVVVNVVVGIRRKTIPNILAAMAMKFWKAIKNQDKIMIKKDTGKYKIEDYKSHSLKQKVK